MALNFLRTASDTCCGLFCSQSALQKYPWCELLSHWILFSVKYALLTKQNLFPVL